MFRTRTLFVVCQRDNGRVYLLPILIALVVWLLLCGLRVESQVVNFPDPNLEAAVRAAIPKLSGDILQSDLDTLTALDASNREILNLAGIENCTSLTVLHLHRNNISDITLLGGLTSLVWLRLSENDISQVGALAGLFSLTSLYIDRNDAIANISMLGALVQLRVFDVTLNAVTNISVVANYSLLEQVFLGSNAIAGGNLQPLAGLANLWKLHACQCGLTDISAVASLPALSELHVEWNELVDLTPLTGLPNLHSLRLDNNNINDIGAVAANPGMGTGDVLDVRWNFLTAADDKADLDDLAADGVAVDWLPQKPLMEIDSRYDISRYAFAFDNYGYDVLWALCQGWITWEVVGHCLGMAASSLVYHQSLGPLPTPGSSFPPLFFVCNPTSGVPNWSTTFLTPLLGFPPCLTRTLIEYNQN